MGIHIKPNLGEFRKAKQVTTWMGDLPEKTGKLLVMAAILRKRLPVASHLNMMMYYFIVTINKSTYF